MPDRVVMKKGDITLTLEPFGYRWCLSAYKVIGESESMYGNRFERGKMQMNLYDDYGKAQASFLRGARHLSDRYCDFEDMCRDAFGFLSLEEITYGVR